MREAYFHCGKALMRSKLWSADTQVERAVMPSISQVIHDQTGLGEPESQDGVVGSATRRSCNEASFVIPGSLLSTRDSGTTGDHADSDLLVLALEPADVLLGVELKADALIRSSWVSRKSMWCSSSFIRLSNRSRET